MREKGGGESREEGERREGRERRGEGEREER